MLVKVAVAAAPGALLKKKVPLSCPLTNNRTSQTGCGAVNATRTATDFRCPSGSGVPGRGIVTSGAATVLDPVPTDLKISSHCSATAAVLAKAVTITAVLTIRLRRQKALFTIVPRNWREYCPAT